MLTVQFFVRTRFPWGFSSQGKSEKGPFLLFFLRGGGGGGLCTDYLNVNAAGVISNEHFNFNVIRICIVLANN